MRTITRDIEKGKKNKVKGPAGKLASEEFETLVFDSGF